jgi:hypothetical protein
MQAVLCDCDFDENSNLISPLCKHCKILDDKQRENKWYEQIKVIKKYLSVVENTKEIKDKVLFLDKLFKYLLTQDVFLAKHTGFRNAVLNKIDELKDDENIREYNLLPLLNNTSIFLNELKNHPDYC